VINLDPYLYAV